MMWQYDDHDNVQHDTFNDPSAGFIEDHGQVLTWITNAEDDAVTYTEDGRFEVTDTVNGYLLRVNVGTAEVPSWQLVELLFETRDHAQDYAESMPAQSTA